MWLFLHSNVPRAENDHCSFPGMQYWPRSGNADLTSARCLIKNIRIKRVWHFCFSMRLLNELCYFSPAVLCFIFKTNAMMQCVDKQFVLTKKKRKKKDNTEYKQLKCSPLTQYPSSDHHLNKRSGIGRTNALFPWLSSIIQPVRYSQAFLSFIIFTCKCHVKPASKILI